MAPKNKGKLEVVCGSMFSGKSEELIRRLRRAEFANLATQVFKHTLDTRKTIEHIHAHSGDKLPALAIENEKQLLQMLLPATKVIGIDEVQFFSADIIHVINTLIDQGKRVIVAGLDTDFRTAPFGCMPALLALADEVEKLKAVCMCCGNDAQFTQRLVNGKPAHINDPVIVIGAEEAYQARCRNCHQISHA